MFKISAMMVASYACLVFMPPVNAEEKVYTFQGDRSAQKICRAIVRDKPKQLKIQLMRASKFNAIPYRVIHNEYSCNNLALIDFAYDVEAVHSIAYLKTRGAIRTKVTMEEIAAR